MTRKETKYQISEKYMSALELSDVLGVQLRKVLRTDLTPEQREELNATNKFVIALANQQINAHNLILNGEKVLAENGDLDKSVIKTIIHG